MKKNIKITFILVVIIAIIIIFGISIYNNSKENDNLENIQESSNYKEADLSKSNMYLESEINNDKAIDYGIITNVDENVITIKNEEIDYSYEIKIDKDTKITNYRTTEEMNISDIKVGDYYSSGKVVRNISGEEWEKECIKNLAYCYEEGNLICNSQEITDIRNMGDYVIITLIMEDSTMKYFNEDDSINTFELRAIAYSSLDIPTYSGGVTVYNLKEEVEGFMFWIGLNKNTINNQYPVISNIEIYDK